MQYAINALENAILIDEEYINNCKADIIYYKDDKRRSEASNDIARSKERIREYKVAIKVLKKVK